MNERAQDYQWLRQFARQGDQQAFAALVRRHLDLVYATALRRLEDPGMAEEVAQTVLPAQRQVKRARQKAISYQSLFCPIPCVSNPPKPCQNCV